MSRLQRWAVMSLGLAVVAGVQAVMAMEGVLSFKMAMLTFASAAGGALVTALQNFDRSLLRKEELPFWIQKFLEGDASSVPPSATSFLGSSSTSVSPGTQVPATTTGLDLDQ